jgi:hypothetical protein
MAASAAAQQLRVDLAAAGFDIDSATLATATTRRGSAEVADNGAHSGHSDLAQHDARAEASLCSFDG